MHSTLPNNPSKAQELEHLAAFVGQLPQNSYLASMFPPDTLARFQNAIGNDFTPPTLSELWQERAKEAAALAADCEAAAEQREKIRAELAELDKQKRRLVLEIHDYRGQAEKLAANIADFASATATLRRVAAR